MILEATSVSNWKEFASVVAIKSHQLGVSDHPSISDYLGMRGSALAPQGLSTLVGYDAALGI